MSAAGPSQLYRIDAEARVVYLLPGLEADFENWRAHMEAVLTDPAFVRGMNFLSDRRDLPELTKEYVEKVIGFTRANARRLGPAHLEDSEVTVMAFYNFADSEAWVRGEATPVT